MKTNELLVLSPNELIEVEGGYCFGFNWGVFWRGVTIGAGAGGAGAAAYLSQA